MVDNISSTSATSSTDRHDKIEVVPSITNTQENIGSTAQGNNDNSVGICDSYFSKAVSFIKNWGPNYVILQAGPQLHDSLTGCDFKFTPTLVVDADHAEVYPLHNEIGVGIWSNDNHFEAKAYALAVKQQGINIDWKNRDINYLRQELGRIEADIPYGSSGLQATIGLELGITDKTRGLTTSIKHAVQDLTTSSCQALSLVLADFISHKSLTGLLVGGLLIPEVLKTLAEPDNGRERTLWFGFSIGYADYNGNWYENLPTLNDPQHSGINIQKNIYTRHGEMATYNFTQKKIELPYAFEKTITAFYGYSKAKLASEAIRVKTMILNKMNNGSIQKKDSEAILEIVDKFTSEIAIKTDVYINSNNIEHTPDNS